MSKRTFEAWRSQEIFEVGIGHVVICRHRGSGDTEYESLVPAPKGGLEDEESLEEDRPKE